MDIVQTLDEDTYVYLDVQNLSIDHSLTIPEIEKCKDLIFSPNNLQQIYFKDKCDSKTIEVIKSLLAISDYIDDSKIEKYILIDLNQEEKEKILSDVYENPSTWQLPYELDDDRFALTDVPTYRTMNLFISKLLNKELSCIEQIMRIYDGIKIMDFESNDNHDLLTEIIMKKKTNSYGMNKLFSYILNVLGYSTFMGVTDKGDFITLVDVKDEKYNVDGIYAFDPSMDNLSKEDYSKESVRRINYNFFGNNLDSLNRVTYGERLSGILAIVSIDDRDFSIEKIDNIRDSRMLKEKERFLNAFNMNYRELYDRIHSTKRIDVDTIISIVDVLYKDKKENYDYVLKENFLSRKKELFNKSTQEELEETIKEENNKNRNS